MSLPILSSPSSSLLPVVNDDLFKLNEHKLLSIAPHQQSATQIESQNNITQNETSIPTLTQFHRSLPPRQQVVDTGDYHLVCQYDNILRICHEARQKLSIYEEDKAMYVSLYQNNCAMNAKIVATLQTLENNHQLTSNGIISHLSVALNDIKQKLYHFSSESSLQAQQQTVSPPLSIDWNQHFTFNNVAETSLFAESAPGPLSTQQNQNLNNNLQNRQEYQQQTLFGFEDGTSLDHDSDCFDFNMPYMDELLAETATLTSESTSTQVQPTEKADCDHSPNNDNKTNEMEVEMEPHPSSPIDDIETKEEKIEIKDVPAAPLLMLDNAELERKVFPSYPLSLPLSIIGLSRDKCHVLKLLITSDKWSVKVVMAGDDQTLIGKEYDTLVTAWQDLSDQLSVGTTKVPDVSIASLKVHTDPFDMFRINNSTQQDYIVTERISLKSIRLWHGRLKKLRGSMKEPCVPMFR